MDSAPTIAWHDWPTSERRRLLDELSVALATVPGVSLVYAHGSFVRGGPFRDLDLAVWFEPPFTWRGLGRIEDAVRRGRSLPFPVDVVPLNDAPPHFRARVAHEGHLLLEARHGLGHAFWVEAHSELIDLAAWRHANGPA